MRDASEIGMDYQENFVRMSERARNDLQFEILIGILASLQDIASTMKNRGK